MWKVNSKIGKGDDAFLKHLDKLSRAGRLLDNVSYGFPGSTFDKSNRIVRIDGRFEDYHHSQGSHKSYDINSLPWHLCN